MRLHTVMFRCGIAPEGRAGNVALPDIRKTVAYSDLTTIEDWIHKQVRDVFATYKAEHILYHPCQDENTFESGGEHQFMKMIQCRLVCGKKVDVTYLQENLAIKGQAILVHPLSSPRLERWVVEEVFSSSARESNARDYSPMFGGTEY